MTQHSPESSDFLYKTPDLLAITRIFENAKNWQEKYRQLMLLGKQAPKLTDELKLESAKIDGCESAAWLYHQYIDGKHYFIADSDARIVKGLIVILLALYHDHAEKTEIEVETLFTELGLFTQLSPSRTNGLSAMAKAMLKYL